MLAAAKTQIPDCTFVRQTGTTLHQYDSETRSDQNEASINTGPCRIATRSSTAALFRLYESVSRCYQHKTNIITS